MFLRKKEENRCEKRKEKISGRKRGGGTIVILKATTQLKTKDEGEKKENPINLS